MPLDVNNGVTVIVPVTVADELFMVLKALTFPNPFAAKPIEISEFDQE